MSEERDQPTFTSSGGATMGLPTASLTARTRVNFAVQHMLAAARFARRTGELEAAHAGEQFGDFFNEIMHFASATILFSAAALEANINEIFIDATVHFPNEDPASLKAIWDKLEKTEFPL